MRIYWIVFIFRYCGYMLKYCYEDFGVDKFMGINVRSFVYFEFRSFFMEREGEGRGEGCGDNCLFYYNRYVC